MHGGVDLQALPFPFPFKDTLGDGGDDTVMSPFDQLKRFGKSFIVVIQFRGPFAMVVGRNKVSSGGGRGLAVSGVGSGGRRGSVLSFTDTGILGSFGEDPGRTAVKTARPKQTSSDLLGQGRATKSDDFLGQ